MYIFWPKALQAYLVKKCKCCFSSARKEKEREAALFISQDNEYDDFDHVDSGEEELYADDWMSNEDEGGTRKKKEASGIDRDEDEWT